MAGEEKVLGNKGMTIGDMAEGIHQGDHGGRRIQGNQADREHTGEAEKEIGPGKKQ